MESGSAVNPGGVLLRAVCVTLSVVLLQGCVSVDSLPHQSYVEDDGERVHCTQYFPKWQLGMDVPTYSCDGYRGESVCLVFFGVSAVVSGSVYAVGNVLHWAERDGECTARARLVPTDSNRNRQQRQPLKAPDT